MTLENNYYIAEINFKGAEPKRLFSKTQNRELIWKGDPQFWGRHAPVLFPIVGKVKNGSYQHLGKSFEIGQHGFARDLAWKLIDQKDTHCQLQLCEDDWTMSKYPFQFEIIASFHLNENGLNIQYTVKNEGNATLFFSIGTHPAFNCPWQLNDSIEDYMLHFEHEENAEILLLNNTGLRTGKRTPFLNSKILPLKEELFKNDALIFDDLKSNSLSIRRINDHSGVRISWQNLPHLGIWKPLGAPFLCIEPWQGMADLENFEGELKDKFGIIELQEGEQFNCGYQVQSLSN